MFCRKQKRIWKSWTNSTQHLLEQGVEITDQKDSLIWDQDEEEAPDTSDDYIKDIADDSVRLYLREIGKIPAFDR